MKKLQGIFPIVRNFLFSTVNKEFLIFLFFLALSGVFWLMMTLNETYEKEMRIPVHIINVPQNVVLTSDSVDTVKVSLSDKGFVLLGYMYGDGLRPLKVNFKNYMRSTGTGSVTAAELQRMMYQQLSASTKITSTKPDRLEYFFNYGLHKRVPLRWSGRVIPEHLYFISHTEYETDSVDIYASQEKLDSINIVYTEPLNYANFRDTLSVRCNLQKMRGVKSVPDNVKITFYTDVLTEASIKDIPIQGINMPEGKVLRTFPSKVTIKFVAGVSLYRTLSAKDFTVVADYKDIASHPSDKCTLHIKKVPQGISRATLDIKQVDYLIEEDRDYARKLFRATIMNADEYQRFMGEASRNWDFNRLAYMDVVIMQIAIAEIMTFPSIPISVTINEFVEIAKLYSTPRSSGYINGMLDAIARHLIQTGRLMKSIDEPKKKY